MRDAKRWTAYAALLVAPIAAGGSIVVASGLASFDALAALIGGGIAAVTAWFASRRNGVSSEDDDHTPR